MYSLCGRFFFKRGEAATDGPTESTGVADMEKYSEATRLIRMDGAKGATLAGAFSGVDRRAIRETTDRRSTKRKSYYYAQQTIQENCPAKNIIRCCRLWEAEATVAMWMSKMMVAGAVRIA